MTKIQGQLLFGVAIVLIVGAYFLGQMSATTPQSVAKANTLPQSAPVLTTTEINPNETTTDTSAEVHHLEARIADCQNEIYAANNSVWLLNNEITQFKIGATSVSSLQYQNQVNDLVDSVGGNTLCFEDDTAQYKQSKALNDSQQQESLVK